ncbi:hypothetical protein [Oceanospirillum linum]|uniref:Phage abortive infection protein n=1 Tax=Oceanospirillum linum TaxID=966 RepID=A0A1T1HDU7_OCELI|nr:hypothetical protein [Oceanospirillum linum]OOV88029.1 hypothetical protein BTA35_0200245 [Oceanospirillum linum]SEF40823.1 hypothetical protein SAMN04489856_10150 [Oleiphilus messinensis]SMP00504.1 hypothetical protein SAMN06264348_10151 [Oceanospirillum linum]
MDSTDIINLIPAGFSALATCFAAFATFKAYQVAKESKNIAEKSLIASEHEEAKDVFFESFSDFELMTSRLFNLGRDIREYWTRKFDLFDDKNSEHAGEDPRPLRHVLSNAAEMLAKHSMARGRSDSYYFDYLIDVLNGDFGDLNLKEYYSLLERADGCYLGYESIFGEPKRDESIELSEAFRFSIYQLKYRTSTDDLRKFISDGWSRYGFLRLYYDEFIKCQIGFESIARSLTEQKNKLKFSYVKLDDNVDLSANMERLARCVSLVLNCGFGVFEQHIEDDWSDLPDFSHEELIGYILFQVAITYILLEVENQFFQLQQ